MGPERRRDGRLKKGEPSRALLVDLYELTMAEAYLRAGVGGTASFSLFVRTLPPERNYLVAAGLAEALDYLAGLRFTPDDLAFLRSTGRFSAATLDYLAGLRFTGAVRAVPEGRVVFAGEPLLEVTGPLIEAQLVETYLINALHLHTVIASKAARCVDAAEGRAVLEFGLRRAHGIDAGMAAARSAWISGCAATSNVAAGRAYEMPIAGTMAHSFITSFPDELTAFRAYAAAYPDSATLLIDTYDTVQGARHAAIVAAELAAQGHRLRAVRIDSGDLLADGRRARRVLDEAVFPDVQIVASGGLDERQIAGLVAAGAPYDAFGVGTRMDTPDDAPTLDAAYKQVEVGGRPVMKRSSGKAMWPGRKQVWRFADAGSFTHDLLAHADEPPPAGAEPLLVPVMAGGRPLHEPEPLSMMRERCAADRARLPAALRRVEQPVTYPVEVSAELRALYDQLAKATG